MPTYKDVAQLKVASLIDEADRPQTVQEEDSLRVVSERLGQSSGRAVVVMQGEEAVTGVISPADVTTAIGQGMPPETSARELIARKPPVVTVSDSSLLEELPTLVGPYSILIVTDSAGRPVAVLDREVLAERVKTRFVTSS